MGPDYRPDPKFKSSVPPPTVGRAAINTGNFTQPAPRPRLICKIDTKNA